ncbi:MAG: DUF2007 domain-containing protein [Flavobacteriales bacterium]|nr:DUF2007 domain-containing protein [Flavobacteriales bacterium]
MDTFVTVATFMWPTDAVVPCALLESAGIKAHVKDEMTVQIQNLASQAVGGLKIQVPADDAEHARDILREAGFLVEGSEENPHFWLAIDRATRRVPLLGRIDLLMARVLVLVAIVLLAIGIPIAIMSQPDAYELLSSSDWCIDGIEVKGQPVQALSTSSGLMITYAGCEERLTLESSGSATLPGFNSPVQYAAWRLDDTGIHFEDLAMHQDVYGGSFSYEVNEWHLTLTSPTTTIYCSKFMLW